MLMKVHQSNAARTEVAKAQPLEKYFLERKPEHFGLAEIKQVLVVSDLHLGEGQLHESAYWDRLENFTTDEEFVEFLEYKQSGEAANEASVRERAWPVLLNGGVKEEHKLLVLNGDFIDFLRVTRTPSTANLQKEFKDWFDALAELPQDVLHETKAMANFEAYKKKWEKFASTKRRWQKFLPFLDFKNWGLMREKRYGFNADDFKSIYRLDTVAKGHPKIFTALRKWIEQGSALAIVTGNHDPEFDQTLVQAWVRKKLGADSGKSKERLHFVPRGVELWERIRLEHGQRYEWHTATERLDAQSAAQEITLPAGSFFNRYFVNKVETVAPYLDNVRPVTRVIAYLVRNRTLETLNMLGQLSRAVLLLLFTGSWNARLFLGYSALALVNGLMGAANFIAWFALIPLALYRAFRIDWRVGILGVILGAALVWLWNLIAERTSAWLLHRKARARVIVAVIALAIMAPTLGVIAWLRSGNSVSDFLALLHPLAPVKKYDFIEWLVANLKTPQWDLLLSFWPVAALTLMAWGMKLVIQAARPHFDKKQVRAKMLEGWRTSPAKRFASCGHTHIPDKQNWPEDNAVYLNSGTWTPVFEYETDVVRDDLTKTFVEFYQNKNGDWEGELRRWESPMIRENKVVLVKPRNMKAMEEQVEVVAIRTLV